MWVFLQLAQAIPDTTDLKSGDTNTILVWIIGVLLLVIGGFLWREKQWEKKQGGWDAEREKKNKQILKLALRVQTALEIWAGIEEQESLVDDNDEEDE